MRSNLLKIRRIDEGARLLGLDIGRKFTGVSVASHDMKIAKGVKTLELNKYDSIGELSRPLHNLIRKYRVKGIIVGYPLDDENRPTKHCLYVKQFLDSLIGIKKPVTLVNEYGSTLRAKVKIAAAIQSNQALLGMQQNQRQIEGGDNNIMDPRLQGRVDPNILLRKGIYDKVAAEYILQQYLDFYNSEDDLLLPRKDV